MKTRTGGLVTLAIALLCLGAAGLQIGTALQFDRLRIPAGEVWRVFTGHLVHWNTDHLFWDLLMFVVLGVWCERKDLRRYTLCLVGSSLAISLGVWLFTPHIQTYRGLSGIDTALFMLLGVQTFREKLDERDWIPVMIVGSLLVGLSGKMLYEFTTGTTLFVDSQAAGFEPLVMSHLLGAIVGGGIALCRTRWTAIDGARISTPAAEAAQ